LNYPIYNIKKTLELLKKVCYPTKYNLFLDIDLNNLTFIKQFYWYLNYLNAIISDIKRYVINYKSETLFNCQLDDFISIKTFFDTSSNVFTSSTYKGTVFNLSTSDYNKIVSINSLFNSVIIFIINLLENKTITLDDNQINLYTSIETSTIYNNVIFGNLTLGELIFSLPLYYTNNFFLTYKYSEIVSFYNDVKTAYIDQYKLILDEFLNYGGFSPAVIPSFGYSLNNNDSVQFLLLGNAGIMLAYGHRF
jgi:hypothetical protein